MPILPVKTVYHPINLVPHGRRKQTNATLARGMEQARRRTATMIPERARLPTADAPAGVVGGAQRAVSLRRSRRHWLSFADGAGWGGVGSEGGRDNVLRQRTGRRGHACRLRDAPVAELKPQAAAGQVQRVQDTVAWVPLVGNGCARSACGMTEERAASVHPHGVGGSARRLEHRGRATAGAAIGAHPAAGNGRDDIRIGWRGQVRWSWAPCGGTVVQPGVWERTWVCLTIAVHGGSGVVQWAWRANVTAATLAATRRRWGERGVTAVVWDRAPGQHGNAAATVPVQRLEHPAYLPVLHPAKRGCASLRNRTVGNTDGL